MAKPTPDPADAILPEDREFLEQHGWHDTSGDYPTIGTEEIRQ